MGIKISQILSPRKRTTVFACCWLSLYGCGAWAQDIQTWTHREVAVYFLPATQAPIVDVELWFRAGSAYTTDNSAAAIITNEFIGRATTQKNQIELDLALGLLGTKIGRGINRDGGWVRIRSLTKRFAESLDHLGQIIGSPRWSEKLLEKLRAENRSRITHLHENDQSRLNAETYKLIYGDHPYAKPVAGALEDNCQLDLDQVRAFYREHYTLNNMMVLVVGKTDKATINAWIDQLGKTMTKGKKLANPVWVKKTPLASKKHIETDSTQVNWNLASLGFSRHHPDYPISAIAVFMLGKLLDKVIRDEKGYTYSTGAYAEKLLGRGMIVLYFSTLARNALPAIKATQRIRRRFFTRPVDKDDLILAKNHLTGLLSISYDSNYKQLGLLRTIASEGLPPDYLTRLIDRINQIEPDDLNHFLHQNFIHRDFSSISIGARLDANHAKKNE